MKKSLFLVCVALLALPFFAFAEGSAESSGPVEFDFWTTEVQSDRMATIQVLIDTFSALNPDITINLIPVQEEDQAAQLNAAAAAGNLPALIQLSAEEAVSFGSEGFLDSDAIDGLLAEIGEDNFYAGALRMVSTGDGGYYALPYSGWIQGIWYREDWFAEAGLDPPTTWDSILEAARYFYRPGDNQYGILVGTTAETFTEQCFTPIAMSNDAALFDRNGNLIFNSPEMREAVEFYAELAKYNPPGPQYWRGRDYYIQGKMAMFFYSTFIMDDLALAENAASSLTGDNFADLQGSDFDPDLASNTGFASIITNERPAGFGVINTMAIMNQSDNAVTEAAKKFLRYLYTQNAYITYLHMAPGGFNPTLKGIASNARYTNDPRGLFANYGAKKMDEIIQGMQEIETFSIVDGNRIEAASQIYSAQIIPQMLYAITQEGADIDIAMDRAERAMLEIVNE
jgi:multiple sugar transport system substrate-binding protein